MKYSILIQIVFYLLSFRPEELRNLTREFDRRRIALNIEFIEGIILFSKS